MNFRTAFKSDSATVDGYRNAPHPPSVAPLPDDNRAFQQACSYGITNTIIRPKNLINRSGRIAE